MTENYKDTEEGKIYWITINIVLNGLNVENYDWLAETKNWAKGADYFPDISWEDFLLMARKYSFWLEFEKIIFDR